MAIHYQLIQHDGQVFSFGAEGITLGRGNQNDVVISGANVSRQHARILVAAGKCWIRDESQAGTILDGRPVQGQQEFPIGSVLQIGNVTFRLVAAQGFSPESSGSPSSKKKKQQMTILGIGMMVVFVMVIVLGSGGGGGGGGGGSLPTPDPNGNYIIIPDTTIVLGEEIADDIIQIQDGGAVLVFDTTSNQIANLKKDDVLVVPPTPDAPGGLLRKVVSVEKNGSQIVVETVQGTLAEAIEEARVHYEGTLKADDATVNVTTYKMAAPAPIRIEAGYDFYGEINNLLLADFDENPDTTDDQIISNLGYGFDINFVLDFEIKNFQFTYFEFEYNLSKEISMDLLANMRPPVHVGQQIELYSYKFPNPYIVWFGAFPLFIMPEVNVVASWTVGGAVIFSASGSHQVEFSASTTFDGTNWNTTKTENETFTLTNTDIDGEGELNLSIGVEAVFAMYTLTGPFVGAGFYVEPSVNTAAPVCWKIDYGMYFEIGMRVEIMDRRLVNFARIWEPDELRKTWKQAAGPCFPTATPAPTATPIVPDSTLESVTVTSRQISISVRDNGQIDGDRIRLTLNGEVILQDYTLTGSYYSIDVDLYPGNNELVITALNEGSVSPNTVEVTISNVASGETSQIADGLETGNSIMSIIAP